MALGVLVIGFISGAYVTRPPQQSAAQQKATVAPTVKSKDSDYSWNLTCCDDPLSIGHATHIGMERQGLLKIGYRKNQEDDYRLLPP